MLRLSTAALALTLVAGCGPDASPDAVEAPDAPAEPAAAGATDACALLTPEAIAAHVPDADAAAITAEDVDQASEYADGARSCTWRWDGGQVALDVRERPADSDAATWASGRLEARVAEQGYARVDGVGDEAAVLADRSELFWREGETRTGLLSYGGPSPDARLAPDAMVALAQEVGR